MTPLEIAFIVTLARGAVLVPVLLAAEFCLRRTLTAGCRRMLWGVCAIWLVIPQSSSKILPWQVDFTRINNGVRRVIVSHVPGGAAGIAQRSGSAASGETAGQQLAAARTHSFIGFAVLFRQWRSYELLLLALAGLPACLWLSGRYLRCRRGVRRLPEVGDPRILGAWRRVAGDSTRLRLFDADSMRLNPTLFGFFNQRLLLPVEKLRALTDQELELLLEHEYCHYRAGDSYLNMMSLILSRFFWYNPLLFVVRKRLRQSCELHCDEQVLRRHPHAVRIYGNLLLRFAGATVPPEAMGLSEKPRELSHRIRSMVRGRPAPNTARAGRISAVCLILLLSCPVLLVAVNVKPRFTKAPAVRRDTFGQPVKPLLPHLTLEYSFSPKPGVMRWKISYPADFPAEHSTLTLRYDDHKIVRDLSARPEYIELAMKHDLENIQFTYQASFGGETMERTFALPMADYNRFAGRIDLQPNRSAPLLEMLPFQKVENVHITWNGVQFQRRNYGWEYQREYTLRASLSIPGIDAGDYQSPAEYRAERELPILLIERDLNLDPSAFAEVNPELVRASENLRILEYEHSLGGADYHARLEAREAVIRLELRKLGAVGEAHLTPRWLKYREGITRELQESLLQRGETAALMAAAEVL
jgi:hypothetical protein